MYCYYKGKQIFLQAQLAIANADALNLIASLVLQYFSYTLVVSWYLIAILILF